MSRTGECIHIHTHDSMASGAAGAHLSDTCLTTFKLCALALCPPYAIPECEIDAYNRGEGTERGYGIGDDHMSPESRPLLVSDSVSGTDSTSHLYEHSTETCGR